MNYTDIKDFNPFLRIGSDWALLGAVMGERKNAMTVSWGDAGVLWNKPIFTVYVRPTRYTYHLIEGSDIATLSFFDESMKKTLSYFGRVSGKDEDKFAYSKIEHHIEDGALMFDRAKLTLVGRKLYYSDIDPRHFKDEAIDLNYSGDYHRAYTYEIIKVCQ